MNPDLEDIGRTLGERIGRPPDSQARRATALAMAERSLRRQKRRQRVVATVVIAAAVVGPLWWGLRADRDELAVTRDGVPWSGELLETGSASELTFSEATRIDASPATRLRVLSRRRSDMQLVLERGRVAAAVTPGGHWRIEAGPYVVRVVGTVFSVDWAERGLTVEVQHGRVEVAGGVLAGRAVSLSAGERLAVERDRFSVEPISPAVAPAGAERADAGENAPEGETLAELVPEAELPQAPLRRPKSAATRDAPGEALARCDAARLARQLEVAEHECEALHRRFPRTDVGAEAAFRLGRMAFESGQWDAATRWFRSVYVERPKHPLAPDAKGREMESLARAGHATEAAESARRVLLETPDGPWAARAKSLLR